jgi:hypothetical protein
MRISQIITPPFVKSVGNMGLLYGSRRKVQSAKIGKPPGGRARDKNYFSKRKDLSWRSRRLGG